jgi:carboxypeptidase Taq
MGWPADGRIDHTEHPFAMSGVPGDPRITTHYSPGDPLMTLLAAVHECGHGMYELNLPKDGYAYQPVGGHRGASTHESQSLGMEMLACRSAPFLEWMFPQLREELGTSDEAWSNDNLLAHYRHVRPSFIRVNADEVTYPLHVILRYNLEQRILDRELAVRDIPDAWNEEMQRLLGVRPNTFAEGCLQDIHWSMGLVGYFPTYLLGALKAAQFFDAAKNAHPGLVERLGDGDFGPWLGWLKENVHRHASLYGSDELLERATGRELQTAPLIEHLKSRYLPDA